MGWGYWIWLVDMTRERIPRGLFSDVFLGIHVQYNWGERSRRRSHLKWVNGKWWSRGRCWISCSVRLIGWIDVKWRALGSGRTFNVIRRPSSHPPTLGRTDRIKVSRTGWIRFDWGNEWASSPSSFDGRNFRKVYWEKDDESEREGKLWKRIICWRGKCSIEYTS